MAHKTGQKGPQLFRSILPVYVFDWCVDGFCAGAPHSPHGPSPLAGVSMPLDRDGLGKGRYSPLHALACLSSTFSFGEVVMEMRGAMVRLRRHGAAEMFGRCVPCSADRRYFDVPRGAAWSRSR